MLLTKACSGPLVVPGPPLAHRARTAHRALVGTRNSPNTCMAA